MLHIPESWLHDFNTRMTNEEVPHVARPFRALMEWSKLQCIEIQMNTSEVDHIFEWFYQRSPPDSHNVQPMYRGAFLFDAYFWPVLIPQVYGTNITVDLMISLPDMPPNTRVLLYNNSTKLTEYKTYWADCFDYVCGGQSLPTSTCPDGKLFLSSGDQQLRSSAQLLVQAQPQPRSMECSRLAVEMFFKALLCLKHGWNEQRARQQSHRLDDLLREIEAVDSTNEITQVRAELGVFPPVGDRYAGREYSRSDLWTAHRIAQLTGAAVIRSLVGRRVAL